MISSLPALRYAASAARLKSFSAAARECGVAQPTVSAAVAELEAALGAPLFQRAGRQLLRTPQGQLLLPRIEAVLAALEDLQAEAQTLASTAQQQLRIGFTPLAGATRVAALLEPFRQQHPGCTLLFHESGGDDLQQRLDAGELDLIIGCGMARSPQRRRLQLLQDPLVLCAQGPSHAKSGPIDLQAASAGRLLFTEDLCGLASATRALFEGAGLAVDAYPGRALSYSALEDWVGMGLGSAVIPRVHVRNPATARTLVGPEGQALTLALDAVWSARAGGNPSLAGLLSLLHRTSRPDADSLPVHGVSSR